MGQKKNRILVEVYAGENSENNAGVDPYITNAITSNCYHVSGSGFVTSSGIVSGSKCFWVTKGVGLVEDAGLPTQRDYPQCHNGQFGFVIKLGKILTDPVQGFSYLVRLKLRTDSNGITDSPWARVKISRQLTPSTVPAPTPTPASFSCNLKPQVSRFNPNLSYALFRSYNLTTGSSAPAVIPSYTVRNGTDPVAYNFDDVFLVDGVTYNYRLDVSENQYAPYAVPPLASSVPAACTAAPPFLNAPTPGVGTCTLSLLYSNPTPGIMYQIGVKQYAGWTKQPFDTAAIPPGTCTSSQLANGTCTIAGLSNTTLYYFAVHAGRGGFDPAVNEAGAWSNEQNCRPQ